MPSHFPCIGFPIRQMSEYEGLMREAAAKGERLPLPGGGMLARWEVGDGPGVWALGGAQGGGGGGGGGRGGPRAAPGEPISGAFPVRIDLVNFPLVRARLRVGDVVPIEFCGIAHEAALYEDTGAYATAGGGGGGAAAGGPTAGQLRPPLLLDRGAGHSP